MSGGSQRHRPAAALLALRTRLQRWFRIAEWQAMLLWSIAAGVLGALTTEGFRLTLVALDRAVFGEGDGLVAIATGLPWWARLATPAVGGLVAGLLLEGAKRFAPAAASPDYMEAIVLGDGRIPPAHTLVRSASSLVSIASGGSIGREGSMVQLAALAASALGRLWRFPRERLRVIVACGAAAGLTAAYSAPIAGAFFIAEIVLGSIAMESVGPILVAAVTANITMRHLPGYRAPYEMPEFPTVSGLEVLLFAALGVVLGVAAALFLRGLAASRRGFASLPVALPWRLALGGAVTGAVSIAYPQVWGNGYSIVNAVLHSPWPAALLATLLAAKLIATMATAGSGAVGGVFTPALFVGCLTGALFGQAVQWLWPGGTSAPFAYAIVGMGAFLAGATQAPLMAILMIFEMTLSYQVMLPLMASSVVAYFVARTVHTGSMYEITVHRRREQDERLRLRTLQMRDLIEPAQTVVTPDAGLEEMSRLFLQYPVKYLYAVDARGVYLGVVPLKSLSAARPAEAAGPVRAGDLVCQEIAPLDCEMDLSHALQRFMEHRGERLPVVAAQGEPVLLGVVNKSRLLATYVRLSGDAA